MASPPEKSFPDSSTTDGSDGSPIVSFRPTIDYSNESGPLDGLVIVGLIVLGAILFGDVVVVIVGLLT